MLGAAQTLSTLGGVSPDSVPPQKVKQIPVSTQEANEARLKYKLSALALSAWSDELVNLENKVADYDEIVSRTGDRVKFEYDILVRDVRGRTGDSDVEVALERQWWNLWAQAYQAWENRPSDADQRKAELIRFLSNFISGSQAAWQNYSSWAISLSGPLLRKYHDTLEHLAKLEANLLEAMASGEFSAGQLYDQEQAVGRAREAVNTVRNVYKKVSVGGNIDEAAVEVFGPVELGAIGISHLLEVIIVTVGSTIIWATAVVFSVAILTIGGVYIFSKIGDKAGEAAANLTKLVRDNPVGTTAMIGVILGMIALPFALFRSKEVVIQPRLEIQ
jgi:hypothetical protein